MANKAKMENKFWVVDTLEGMLEGTVKPSRHLLIQLERGGFVQSKEVKTTVGRGRGRRVWEVSGKGRSRIALAKNWKRPAAE